MTSKLGSEIYAMAKGLPETTLTPESRTYDYHMRSWHRDTDEELDRGLELWYTNELAGQANTAEQHANPLNHSTRSAARTATMPDGDNTNSAAVAPEISQDVAEGHDHQSSFEATDNALSPQSNEFDNPEFHIPKMENHHVASLAKAHLSPLVMPKQEPPATAVMTPSDLADGQSAYPNTNIPEGAQPMQRGSTEPTIHSSTHWQSDSSGDSPTPNTMHDQNSGMHQGPHATWQRLRGYSNSSNGRTRAQTYNNSPTSFPRQFSTTGPGSNLKHEILANNLDHSMFAYGSTQYGGAMPRQYHQMMSNNGLAHPLHGTLDSYISNFHGGTYNHIFGSGAGSMGEMSNSHDFINKHHIQHNNNDGPLSTNSHNNPHDLNGDLLSAQFARVPSHTVLKSQPLPSSVDSRGPAHLVRPQARGAVRNRPSQSHMAEGNHGSEAHDPELHYSTIEAAKHAERPKFKTNPKKDPTIPRTDRQKQEFVARMIRCMKTCKRAEDNQGMISQWNKLKQDEPRVEQAAWRLLDLTLQLHEEGIPMLPNKPSCNRYATMRERWDAICQGLQSQKTMCKHLLGAEFTAQLVNDPTTATQRVQNNRKVNAGKKQYLDHGRSVVNGNTGRRGSSASTQYRAEDTDDDDKYGGAYAGFGNASLGDVGDEDAEGDVDEGYINATAPIGVDQFTAASPDSAAVRRPKPKLDADDSDYNGGRVKRSRRTLGKEYPVAPKRRIKNPRRPGYNSKMQVVGDRIVDLEVKAEEDFVYSHGDERAQEIFTKIHYPNGRPSPRSRRYANGQSFSAGGNHQNTEPSSASSSRRVSRAAAPTSFIGQDDSDEGDDQYSDNKTEEHPQGAGHRRS
ncbi:MAG: hypothetical protein Q9166_002743 [cf. Caloplaca sp. 2 TL-2023]